MKNILITGGAGFIGSNFVKKIVEEKKDKYKNIVVLDKLTYAGNINNISKYLDSGVINFAKGDIANKELVGYLLSEHKINEIINFAAETHVDNSIASPSVFIDTNVVGTFNLLEASLDYYKHNSDLRFLHVSTDEVFGTLELNSNDKFNEQTPYNPRSPYSASKASSDHIVNSFVETFDFPAIITNCSNNFGPMQNDEKLIPTIIRSCIKQEQIPVYGDGLNVRDWLYVDDHCEGIMLAVEKGEIGKSYCLGGENEQSNINLVTQICNTMDHIKPIHNKSYKELISFVTDRKGHDRRYAIDCSYAKQILQYKPSKNFEDLLEKTILWYIKQYKD